MLKRIQSVPFENIVFLYFTLYLSTPIFTLLSQITGLEFLLFISQLSIPLFLLLTVFAAIWKKDKTTRFEYAGYKAFSLTIRIQLLLLVTLCMLFSYMVFNAGDSIVSHTLMVILPVTIYFQGLFGITKAYVLNKHNSPPSLSIS
jgi:hypothetical protein